jgi:hypothetical protein
MVRVHLRNKADLTHGFQKYDKGQQQSCMTVMHEYHESNSVLVIQANNQLDE